MPSPQKARTLVGFVPRRPGYSAGFEPQSIQVHVRDHRMRELARHERSVELHYGGFVLSQSRPGPGEARRRALDVVYGPSGQAGRIAGHEARTYPLGVPPPAGDPDGRAPAVVTWHDSGLHYLIASDRLAVETLVRVAESLYP